MSDTELTGRVGNAALHPEQTEGYVKPVGAEAMIPSGFAGYVENRERTCVIGAGCAYTAKWRLSGNQLGAATAVPISNFRGAPEG